MLNIFCYFKFKVQEWFYLTHKGYYLQILLIKLLATMKTFTKRAHDAHQVHCTEAAGPSLAQWFASGIPN
jgi:hypothetical protein